MKIPLKNEKLFNNVWSWCGLGYENPLMSAVETVVVVPSAAALILSGISMKAYWRIQSDRLIILLLYQTVRTHIQLTKTWRQIKLAIERMMTPSTGWWSARTQPRNASPMKKIYGKTSQIIERMEWNDVKRKL